MKKVGLDFYSVEIEYLRHRKLDGPRNSNKKGPCELLRLHFGIPP